MLSCNYILFMPKILKIIQCDEYKDAYSVGDDLEIYLDDIKLDNIQEITFKASIGKASIATIKMLVTPDIRIKDQYLIVKKYRFKGLKEFLVRILTIKYDIKRFFRKKNKLVNKK